MRHVPLSCRLPFPAKPPQHSRPTLLGTSGVRKTLDEDARRFRAGVVALLPQPHLQEDASNAGLPNLERAFDTPWRRAAGDSSTGARPRGHPRSENISLKEFWESKLALRASIDQVNQYHAPLLWHVSRASPQTVMRYSRRAIEGLRALVGQWRAAVTFRKQDRQLRQRSRARKQQRVTDLIQEAQLEAAKGLGNLHRLTKSIAPKSAKRTIHLRDHEGRLLDAAGEIQSLRTYFEDLYQSCSHHPPDHWLTAGITVSESEVAAALGSMSSTKALPPGHVPIRLWKEAAPEIVPRFCQQLSAVLRPGKLIFPPEWHQSFLVLLAKPGKRPSSPANLRPISLLPIQSKLLARVIAVRLQPYVMRALHNTPQFAYLAGRQAGDAVDRVISHSYRTRERLKQYSRSHARTSVKTPTLVGGMQLSLDLKKAYDRLPRHLLERSLTRIGTPHDLVELILFIHDNASLVMSRQEEQTEVGLGRGVRQGCGLSPLLWITYALLLFDTFDHYLPRDAQTGYADDFHIQWEFHRPQEFRNAVIQLTRILSDLKAHGMEVSSDKTVILLVLKGTSAPALLRDFTAVRNGERVLLLQGPMAVLQLPIRKSHLYLGVKIGYGLFERSSVQHRLVQSWVAFHRLHKLLTHQSVPLMRRVQLWQSCVRTVAAYGLAAVGLDAKSAQSLRSQVLRQLHMVARSLSHVTHESNTALLSRLSVQDPVQQLGQQCKHRPRPGRP